jgi:ankyrin repeat protein
MSALEAARAAVDHSADQLLDSIRSGDHWKVRELLRAHPALVGAKGPEGASAILLAVYHGHPEMVPLFVEHGARLDFFEACAVGERDRALALLEAEPSLVRQFSLDGYHGLGLAVFFGHQELVEDLLARGADVNTAAANSQKVTALHAAVARCNRRMVSLLLFRGADANAVQASGFTPLHGAAFHGHRDIAEMLLAHGADAVATTLDGQTPADLARERGHTELALWLGRWQPSAQRGGL